MEDREGGKVDRLERFKDVLMLKLVGLFEVGLYLDYDVAHALISSC